MATPSTATQTATTGQPPSKRVVQTNDFDCWLAAVVTIVYRPLAAVRQVAVEKFKLPKNGPYPFMDDALDRHIASKLHTEVSRLSATASLGRSTFAPGHLSV